MQRQNGVTIIQLTEDELFDAVAEYVEKRHPDLQDTETFVTLNYDEDEHEYTAALSTQKMPAAYE